MKNFTLSLIVFLFNFSVIFGQVGIGTTSPSAQLEIDDSGSGLPALELNPQTSPTGTADGQIAVIGTELYLYDDKRGKWLSTQTIPLSFARSGNRASGGLQFGGNMNNQSSGPIMPFDGTIIAVTANSSGGTSDKEFQIRVRNGTTTNSSVSFNLSSNTYIDDKTNTDFSAGDYLVVRLIDNGDGDVSQPTATIWIKWRN
ncbi:hypothetical protein [Aureitalea marina]|uniref:Uncharacterized protein n=1 Tax=Aureitalea marina TaxID=930804 RepID=A0A2S7KRW0_9FLAO|nr:hypothetical protein [Aureitalea marina]PQB05359.1 hypothetical protein BST85_11025 [Aureitalea marina]